MRRLFLPRAAPVNDSFFGDDPNPPFFCADKTCPVLRIPWRRGAAIAAPWKQHDCCIVLDT